MAAQLNNRMKVTVHSVTVAEVRKRNCRLTPSQQQVIRQLRATDRVLVTVKHPRFGLGGPYVVSIAR
jgi:hypothetical protein